MPDSTPARSAAKNRTTRSTGKASGGGAASTGKGGSKTAKTEAKTKKKAKAKAATKKVTAATKSTEKPRGGDLASATARPSGKPRDPADAAAVALLLRFRDGEREAFEELVERLHPQVYRFLLRMVGDTNAAEDLVQDTFVRVFKAAADYTPRAKLSTWVLQIAKNLCYDYFKRESLRAHQSLSTPVGDGESALADLLPASEGETPFAPLIESEDIDVLHACIARLAEQKRESLVLRFFHELPYEEIAEITGSPSGTIKYRVHEAVQDLIELLSKSPNFGA